MQSSYATGHAMNFNVYLDEATVNRLNALARESGATRNALIRQAVAHLLDDAAPAGWPSSVMAWEGDPSVPPFEGARVSLRPPKADPLR